MSERTDSGNGRSHNSGADTQCSGNAWTEPAWQIEMKLTPFPRPTNLAHIRNLIHIYDSKITRSRARLTPYPGGLFILQEAGVWVQLTDIPYKTVLRSAYQARDASTAQSMKLISRLEDRKRRLEEAFRFRTHEEKFRTKMVALIDDHTKFSLV
jgi:hypothetical protein